MRSPVSPRSLLALTVLYLSLCETTLRASAPPRDIPQLASIAPSPLRSYPIAPQRILWQTPQGVTRPENLLRTDTPGQAVLGTAAQATVLTATADQPAAILIDFGVEISGHIELITPQVRNDHAPVPVRLRFGESASEAMSETPGPTNATNDHSLRDQRTHLPWLGKLTVGPTGFRFLRIDALDPARPVYLSEIRAVLQLRDAPQLGSFNSSDPRLNQIWSTGAYTVHLCMQDYLYDGIKRDRLVWVGDMHPEIRVIHTVFGQNDVTRRSLDLIRDQTPATQWMNGISAYSLWWILLHEEVWLHEGDRAYLAAQHAYLKKLLQKLATHVAPDGRETLDGMRFLDWPSFEDKTATTAGLHALLVQAFDSGARLSDTLADAPTATLCRETAARLRTHTPELNPLNKQSAALRSLAALADARVTSENILKRDGPARLSTFYGYYVLEALARSGDHATALDFIRRYWGAMLDQGATSFWEDFDLTWLEKNPTRIDELPVPGRPDLHSDYGAHCYKQHRHSLCHGWAAGPTAWLTQHILGIRVEAPGCTKVRITPHLGDLTFAEGTFPTPHGQIKVRHTRRPDGTIGTEISAPPQVEILRD